MGNMHGMHILKYHTFKSATIFPFCKFSFIHILRSVFGHEKTAKLRNVILKRCGVGVKGYLKLSQKIIPFCRVSQKKSCQHVMLLDIGIGIGVMVWLQYQHQLYFLLQLIPQINYNDLCICDASILSGKISQMLPPISFTLFLSQYVGHGTSGSRANMMAHYNPFPRVSPTTYSNRK